MDSRARAQRRVELVIGSITTAARLHTYYGLRSPPSTPSTSTLAFPGRCKSYLYAATTICSENVPVDSANRTTVLDPAGVASSTRTSRKWTHLLHRSCKPPLRTELTVTTGGRSAIPSARWRLFTAEQLHPVFGILTRPESDALPARQPGRPPYFVVVELGAGRGEMHKALACPYVPI